MTERECVIGYLKLRLVESYHGLKMDQAKGLNNLLTSVEYMTDDEYRGLENRDVQPA